MTAPDPATTGRIRADELLRHLPDDEAAAEALLEALTEVRDLAFLGAGLTAIGRREGRSLPPAQRAQASTRQLRLAELRDAHRDDVAGLRLWVRRSAEEILVVRTLRSRAG